MSKERSYWFEAKTYGIGWSLPVTWQGWATVAAFLALLIVGAASIDPPVYRLTYIGVVLAAFVGVVVWKGEKPLGWRWGRTRNGSGKGGADNGA